MPYARSRRANPKERAFTLVELLVVVSIIALLIAILLPSLRNARRNAKRVHCNVGLRSIAQAGLTYASDDSNELAIPIGKGDIGTELGYTAYVGFGGKSGQGVNDDVTQSPFGQFMSMNSINRPLNKVLFKGGFGQKQLVNQGRSGTVEVYDADLELDVFHCAGDVGFPGMHHKGWKDSGLSGYDYYGTSYSCNPYLVGYGEGSILESNSIYLRPMSRVPNPSNTVLYGEYAMRFAVFASNHEEYDQTGACWPWSGVRGTEPANGHHGKPWWFNVSYADGHTSWIKIKGFGRVRGVKWGPDCNPSLCQCIVQRGLGWQIDTLPGELIKTHKIRTATNGTLVAMQDGDDPNIWSIVAK